MDNVGIPEHLARNVARFRHDRGWSLSELARRSGRSTRTLAKLEAGHNATLQTLLAVADALGLPLATLMFDGYTGTIQPVHVLRAGDADAVDLGARLISHLAQIPEARHVQLSHVRLSPEAEHHALGHAVGAVERVYLLEGDLELGPLDHQERLRPGDFATLRANEPHVYRAGVAGADYLVLSSEEPLDLGGADRRAETERTA